MNVEEGIAGRGFKVGSSKRGLALMGVDSW